MLTARKFFSVNRQWNQLFFKNGQTTELHDILQGKKKKTAPNLRVIHEEVSVSEQSVTGYGRINAEVKGKFLHHNSFKMKETRC